MGNWQMAISLLLIGFLCCAVGTLFKNEVLLGIGATAILFITAIAW